MNTCFPARKQNGDNYATLDEMMRLIGREPHGSWLAGTNNMWHGGIHISEVSAPGSLLTPETTATAVPLPCMADGGVVAWRLGRDYQKARYLSHAVQYSTTFVLVKSVCKPDPDNAQTWLEFYSLYMGLAPLSAFEKCRCMKVIADGGVRKHPQGQYESSQPDVIPDASEGTLAKDARVIILKEGLFTYRGQSGQPFGLAQELDDEGRECGKPFRVTTSPVYMAPDGEQYARLPVWMQQAVAKGVFDAVVKPDTPLTISAGDAIGFLGEDIAPAGMAKISPSAYAHIEVLSTDSRMPGFLANPGGVNTGRKYIRIHPDAVLYIDSGETFIRTPITVNKDKHLILPVDKCNPREWEGQTYYQAGKNYWLRQDDVDVINQFDLNGLGFTALEEESTPDMSASIKEEWVTSTCRWLAEQVMPERGVRETLTSRFYQSVAEKLDSDRSGDLSGREVYAALHHPDMGVRDIVSRMVVKHESEWYGGSGHQKWTAFFQGYDTLRIDFAKKWLDDMEWMTQVAPFTAGQAVWHMHPVVFLESLTQSESDRCKALFSKVADIILRHEGGYVNDPDDKGGETNMGITMDTWKRFSMEDLGITASSLTLKNMTKEQAETIYYNHFWKTQGFCKLENTKVALMIYDWTITSRWAIREVRALVNKEFDNKLSITNLMDESMIHSINAIDDQNSFLQRLAESRKNYYKSLAIANGKENDQIKFLKGWQKRVDDCMRIVL